MRATSQVLAATLILCGMGLVSLEAGNIYINVHTAQNAGGEVRGQLVAQ